MNGAAMPAWAKYALAFALGVGGTVAATFKTFETRDDHQHDIQIILDGQKEIIRRLDRLIQEGLPFQRLPQIVPNDPPGDPTT